VRWGIKFKIPFADEPKTASFPEPTVRTRYATINGRSDFVTIIYLFEFAPQSWHEMQRVASIKVQMKRLIPSIIFSFEDIGIEVTEYEEVGKIYAVRELGDFFREFILYPKPWYPHSKDEFMSRLTIYAQKLHYEGLLHFESVLAMAMHFNQSLDRPYSFREIVKKTISILKLDRSSWREKLAPEELEQALKQGGKIRGAKISEKARERTMIVFQLLPEYLTGRGSYNIEGLVDATGYSRSTIYSIIKKLKESGKLEC
jgi:hypothetical protein